MKVRAVATGYYGDARRRIGDVFYLKDAKDFSDKWMKKVGDKATSNLPDPEGPFIEAAKPLVPAIGGTVDVKEDELDAKEVDTYADKQSEKAQPYKGASQKQAVLHPKKEELKKSKDVI